MEVMNNYETIEFPIALDDVPGIRKLLKFRAAHEQKVRIDPDVFTDEDILKIVSEKCERGTGPRSYDARSFVLVSRGCDREEIRMKSSSSNGKHRGVHGLTVAGLTGRIRRAADDIALALCNHAQIPPIPRPVIKVPDIDDFNLSEDGPKLYYYLVRKHRKESWSWYTVEEFMKGLRKMFEGEKSSYVLIMLQVSRGISYEDIGRSIMNTHTGEYGIRESGVIARYMRGREILLDILNDMIPQ